MREILCLLNTIKLLHMMKIASILFFAVTLFQSITEASQLDPSIRNLFYSDQNGEPQVVSVEYYLSLNKNLPDEIYKTIEFLNSNQGERLLVSSR